MLVFCTHERLFCTSGFTEESLASAQHGSVAAQRPYMNRNKTSEAAKFDAMNLRKGDRF